ncbi:MAG: sugar phosphate isomerase/epimerase [Phycisphaeraceae bacterium]|nr:sugar phosphate isomerase/epimerase [Phycisphaeraceae bacterium]
MAIPIALQLYTIRDVMSKDPEDGLKRVAQMGYKYVEAAGYAGKTPAEFSAMLKKNGLTCTSAHVGIDSLVAKPGEAVDITKALGITRIVCPYLPDTYWTPEGYRKAAAELSAAAKELAKHKITLSYHNHSFEWTKLVDGSIGMDILVKVSDPIVQFELDVYWVQHGGDKPTDWMKKLKGRVDLLHVKDMNKLENRGFAEVGTGIVDMNAVVKTAHEIGIKYLIVEQDSGWIDGDPMKSAKIGLDNLSKLNK